MKPINLKPPIMEVEERDIISDSSLEDRVTKLERNVKNILKVIRDKQSLGYYECGQKETLERIQSDMKSGNKRIQEGFEGLKAEINELKKSISNREIVNGKQDKDLDKLESVITTMTAELIEFNKRLSNMEGSMGVTKWFMGATTSAIIFYVAYIVIKDFFLLK